MVLKWFKDYVFDRTVNYEFTESFKNRFTLDKTDYEIHDDLNFKLRDYQLECVKSAMLHHFGTFVLGTGAGKTLTIASILHNLFKHGKIKNAVILVPDNGLVIQFNDELKNQYGIKQKICLFYDKFNKIDKDAEIIIANRPLFLSRFEQYKSFWKEGVDCLVVDEAHSIKRTNKVSKCIERMNSHYRFGFTGTLAENKEDKFRNLGILGPVRFEKTSKELRDEGFLTNVLVNSLDLDGFPWHPHFRNYRDELEFLRNCEERNQFLSKLVHKLDKNTLILVNYIEHGFKLESVFNENNKDNKKKIYFIRGEVDTDTRESIKKLMETEDNIVCIAITKIFSTGINIKNLHNIILAAGGKSAVTVVQSIGRGLRLHPSKKQLNIFDVNDKGFKYSEKHATRRKEIYNVEKIPVKQYTINIKKSEHD